MPCMARICVFKCGNCENAVSVSLQTEHLNGFSPVCLRMWSFRTLEWANACQQTCNCRNKQQQMIKSISVRHTWMSQCKYGKRQFYLTSIWPFTRMDTLMHDQLRFLWKCGTTISASMRFNIFVGSHVLRQMPFERSTTNVAEERFHIFMVAREMFLQCIRPNECFAAHVTRVIAHIWMTFQVQFQVDRTRKWCRTLGAMVFLDATVTGQMLRQLCMGRKV